MRIVSYTLRRKSDGATTYGTMEYDDRTEDHTIVYHWTAGNYGCDCNRGDLLTGHMGEELQCCGINDPLSKIELLSLSVDGIALDVTA